MTTPIDLEQFDHVQGATPDEIGLMLAQLAHFVPAHQAIVEIGVFKGRTALLMAAGAARAHHGGAHIWAIDAWDLPGNVYDPPFTEARTRKTAMQNIRSSAYADRITVIHNFSINVADNWSGAPVGLLFVDGDHTKEGARRDIEAWLPYLLPGSIIAIDDYGHPDWPGVREAVDELVAENVLRLPVVHYDRLAVTEVVR